MNDSPPGEVLSYEEKQQLRALANKAKKILPEPVGEIIAQEVLDGMEFGYRFQRGRTFSNLVDFLRVTNSPLVVKDQEI